MKLAVAAAFASGAAASMYGGNVTYTTEVVTAYTTYCPASTTLVHGGSTYTVTEVRLSPQCVSTGLWNAPNWACSTSRMRQHFPRLTMTPC